MGQKERLFEFAKVGLPTTTSIIQSKIITDLYVSNSFYSLGCSARILTKYKNQHYITTISILS